MLTRRKIQSKSALKLTLLYQMLITLSLMTTACKPAPKPPNFIGERGAASSEKQKSTLEKAGGEVAIPPIVSPTPDNGLLLPAFKLVPLQDPVIYTFGSATVSFDRALNLADEKWERFVYSSGLSKLSELEKKSLASLCADISLNPMAGKPQEYQLFWRSQAGSAEDKLLSSIMSKGLMDTHCILQVPYEKSFLRIGITPLASAGDDIVGVDKAKAVAAVIAAPIGDLSKLNFIETNLLKVMDNAVIIRSAKALPRVATAAAKLEGEPCYKIRYGGGGLTAHNRQMEIPYDLTNGTYELAKIKPKPVNSKILTSCPYLNFKEGVASLVGLLGCYDYQTIVSEGMGASCAWVLDTTNQFDKKNSRTLEVQLPKLKVAELDYKDNVKVMAQIPELSSNPFRNGELNIKGGSVLQRQLYTRGMDLWMMFAERYYLENFKGKVKNITFEACNNSDGANAAARAAVGGDTIIICTGHEYNTDKRISEHNYFQYFTAMTVLAHETRHSKGFKHDKLRLDYEPCTGTAHSVEVAISAYECNEERCLPFKFGGRHQFLFEMGYSLTDDPRRFQGLCKTWADTLRIYPSEL